MLITLAENFTLLNVSFQKLKSKAINQSNQQVCMSYVLQYICIRIRSETVSSHDEMPWNQSHLLLVISVSRRDLETQGISRLHSSQGKWRFPYSRHATTQA